MDRATILALAAAGQGQVERLSQQLGKPIEVDHQALIMLVRIAIHQPDGEDYMRVRVRARVEDMIRRAPEATAYKYEWKPGENTSRGGAVPDLIAAAFKPNTNH